jgi:hypothetical protein
MVSSLILVNSFFTDSSSHLQSQYNSSSNAHASSLSSGLQGSCGIQGDLPLDTGHMAAADAYLHSKPNPENAFIKGISPASHSNLPNSLQGSHVIAAEVTKLSNQSSLSNQGSMLRHSEDFGVVGSGSRGKSTGHGLSVGNDGPTDGLSFGSEPISFGLQQVSFTKNVRCQIWWYPGSGRRSRGVKSRLFKQFTFSSCIDIATMYMVTMDTIWLLCHFNKKV